MFQVFRGQQSLSTYRELLADTLLCFLAVLLAAASIKGTPADVALVLLATPSVLAPALLFAVLMSLMYSFVGLYRDPNLSALGVVLRLAGAFLTAGYITYLALKEVQLHEHPAPLVGYALLYVTAGLVVCRGGAWLLWRLLGARRVLIVGAGDDAQSVFDGLGGAAHAQSHFVGFYPTSDEAVPALRGARRFERGDSLQDVVRRHGIDEIIVAAREQRGGSVPMDELLACRIRGVPIVDLAAFYERTKSEVPLESLKASWLVYGEGFVQGRTRRILKRVFDIASSLVLLVVTAPVMLFAVVAIKLDSRGPIIYRQERVGLGGRTFTCLKFRSMRNDAEEDGVARWASSNDARVTRVGRFLRKMRIDEVPQLWSVLKGEMSIVGPRPERPEFVAELQDQIPYYAVRHTVKPGITGWAQVRYTYGASLEDARRKHQFDLYYVKNNTLFLDLLVLIETVNVVLAGKGAH